MCDVTFVYASSDEHRDFESSLDHVHRMNS